MPLSVVVLLVFPIKEMTEKVPVVVLPTLTVVLVGVGVLMVLFDQKVLVQDYIYSVS